MDDKIVQEEKEQKVPETLEKNSSNRNLPSIKENLPTKDSGVGGNIPLNVTESTELLPGLSFDLAGWMNPPPSQKLEDHDKIDDKLAQEDNQYKVPITLKKACCTGNISTKDEGGGGGGSNISLKGIELTELLPEIAHNKIDALLEGENKLDCNSLLQLQQAAIKIMGEQETALDLRDKGFKTVIVVGDLHGSLDCLKCVMELIGLDRSGKNLKKDQVVIFGGDYVDRGGNSLEVLCTLLLLKLSHPESVHLLRGNHEDTMIASIYGFRDEIAEKYEDPDVAEEIWYEFGLVFAAIPICAWTKSAAVMHGGIPNEGFTLKRVTDVSPDVRIQLKTVVDPYDEDEEVIHGVMWSDPSAEPGIGPNDRGAGSMFGPDVAKAFLVEHGLKFLIRAHEPFEEGTDHLDLGDGRGVVTIFSTSNYPNGEGTNLGAVLFLDDEKGEYDIVTFDSSVSPKEAVLVSEECARLLKMYLDDYRSNLTKAFRKLESKDGHVTPEQWALVLGEVFDPDLSWLEYQPQLAPAEDGNINWVSFLNNFSSNIPKDYVVEEEQQSLSRQHKGEFLFQMHKDEFLNVFQLLDVNGSGKIGKQEFVQGIETLNERTGGAKLKDPEKLFGFFQTLRKPSRPPIVTKSISIQQFLRDKKNDMDGGKVSVLEFCKGMEQLADMQGLAGKLDSKEVESLQENKEMLLLAFKHLGVNKRGAIDCEEFSRGIDLLNKSMPQETMLGDPKELFTRLDADGKGEIGLIEFNAIFWSI